MEIKEYSNMDLRGKYFVTYCHNVQIDWFTSFASYLKKHHGISSLCIVQGKEDYRKAILAKGYDNVVDILEDFDYTIADEKLEENLKLLGTWYSNDFESSFYQDLYQDRWLMGKYPYGYIIHFAAHIVRKLGCILAKYPPLVSVGEKNSLPYRIFHHYSRKFDFPHFVHLATRHFPKEKFFLEPDIYWRWPKLIEFYNKYKENGIPEEYLEIAEQKYLEITQKHLNSEKKLIKRGVGSITQKLKLRHIIELYREILPVSKKERLINPRTYRIQSPWKKISNFIRAKKSHRYFDKIALREVDLNKKFCAYFLHFQPEYTIDGLGFGVNNQVELIKTIGASIPADHILLVKEHRVAIGSRPKYFYRDIERLPNVFLVSDDYDGHRLIKKASVLFTVTGSVAIEAMHHQKPAIALGKIFYQAFDGIHTVKDVRNDLFPLVNDMIESPQKYISDKQNSLSVIAAMWHSGHRGCLNPIFINPNLIHKSPNKEKIGKGLEEELKYLGLL